MFLALSVPNAAVAAGPAQLPVKPFVLTTQTGAHKPNVAVDETGTGHFVWDIQNPYPTPDETVYCRVPRGATACQATQTFTIPDREAFGEPQVLTPGPGEVILITHRCCGADDETYAIVSTDGGNTFAPPHLIGTIEPGEAVYGPGTGAVSLVDDVVSAGIHYQAAPLDGYTKASANLGEGASQGYDGTIGFPTPTTPIVAFDDLTTAFVREWGGTGDVNDLSTWGPEQEIGKITEVRIGTGYKGVVLLGKEDVALGEHVYRARRWDPTKNAFGPPTNVSNPKIETDAIFRDIYEDPGGNVHVAFIANGDFGKNSDPMRYRASTDGGKTWGPEKTIVASTNDQGFNLQIGAGTDGGGFIAWDANDEPPLKAVPIPTISQSGAGGPATAGCVPQITSGKLQAIALSGCLQKQKDGSYTSSDPVRINGVDVVPHTSGRRAVAHTAANPEVRIDPKTHKVSIDNADVKAGNIVLDKGSFDWDTDSPVVFAHLEKFHVSIFGFPVAGEATMTFDKDGAVIPAHLELPSVFGGVTGDVTLRLKNPGGLKLDGFKIHVGDAFLGALEIKPLDVEYKGSQPPVFEGSATFLLPPSYGDPGAHVSFGFLNGQFKHAEGTIPFDPALALAPPWVYLKQIGLALSTDPLKIAGGVELIGGPQIFGESAVAIDALPPAHGFSFTFSNPAILRVSGVMKVVDIPFADGFVEFRTNGLFKFGGGLNFTVPLDLASITAGIPEGPPLGPGFLDLSDGRFNAPFQGDVCVPAGCGFIDVGAQGVVSSNGIAACGQFLITKTPKVGVSAGFGYHWGGDADIFGSVGGCDVSPYAESAPARAAQAGTATVTVGKGLPQENIIVQGTTGPPLITVTSPSGETVASGAGGAPAKSAHMVLFSNAKSKSTTVLIATPDAGGYAVAAQPGSSPIAKVGHADGLPEPSVTGRVTGHGHRRLLHWSLKPIPGQSVRFAERSAGAAADLGTAKGTHGTLPFAPAVGPKGTRQIIAMVDQNGVPRRTIPIASYVAPPAARPGRPAFVRVRRGAKATGISWGTASGAAGYVVRVKLHDGTSRLYVVHSKTKRRVSVPAIAGRTFGSVSVSGLTATGLQGGSRRAGVKRKGVKRHRRH